MTTQSDKRLIEVAFPLKETSLDSVHEKNVRHGHISTLHIWPARRPLAASRAALIATLLPDTGDPEKRKDILRRMAGTVVEKIEKKKVGGRTVEVRKEETVGGILHWGRESGPDLDWFRQEISKAYGGRAPKVLDPFAGGGAIPLEAMRLGCDVTAVDINPVAWFILKCTLEYPQKLAGQTRPLPEFILRDREFMESFLKAKGFKGALLRTYLQKLGLEGGPGQVEIEGVAADDPTLQADLAWHVRAWGRWVLAEVRRKLAKYYPTYAEFQALEPGKPFEPRPLRLIETDENGVLHADELNAAFDEAYLKDPRNPRWIVKPTVAYLWARTVTCKQCRAQVPLLKTRWLAKKDNKRVLLTMEPNDDRTGMVFSVQRNVPSNGGNAAQKRENDKRLGAGTMSRSGAYCPCCSKPNAPTIMTMEDIRLEGRAGRLGSTMIAVVVDGVRGKEYRLPTPDELQAASRASTDVAPLFEDIPYGLPSEPLSKDRIQGNSGFRVLLYGLETWQSLFTSRQLVGLGSVLLNTREAERQIQRSGYGVDFSSAILSYLGLAIDKLADSSSSLAHWQMGNEFNVNTFQRFALPMNWDFSEINPLSSTSGSYRNALEWVCLAVDHLVRAVPNKRAGVNVMGTSALALELANQFDLILTDPPYYDAIAYSDVMDFFYVWIRRTVSRLIPNIENVFAGSLSPKWSHEANDGELIDDPSRFDGNKQASKKNYEEGMARAFQACHVALRNDGRLVIVFAHKQPDAWETLVSAIIRAGFVVDGSWPIQTERAARTNAIASASLSSSVWLVCRKRVATARPGWDSTVLQQMRANIHQRLRDFWDAGIRGPDFVWAATGPALEAYSQHPVVKKADAPGEIMTVSEFLREVRRLVVDFVVGRVLSREGDEETMSGLDDLTTYYLLHRHDFGMDEAPIGACILYATACNLSDRALTDQYDLLVRSGGGAPSEEEELTDEDSEESDDVEAEADTGSGAKVKLKAWNQRKGRNLGLEAPGGQPVPLIDQAHRLMHLWKAGEEVKLNEYLEGRGLGRNALFAQLLQALVELSVAGSQERSILESISNHIASRGGITATRQGQLI